MLQALNLHHRFGRRIALHALSLRAEAGELLGLVGPNGAGKTTLLRIMAGVLLPTSGTLTVGGCKHGHGHLVGYLPDGAPLPPELSPMEHLDFIRAVRRARRQEQEELIEQLDLTSVIYQPISALSRGFRQRVGLAGALLGSPPLLLLDEPTSGLDPSQVLSVRALLKARAKSALIIFSSHLLPEVAAVSSRLCLLAQGHLIADVPPDGLSNTASVKLTFIGALESIKALIAALPAVHSTDLQVGHQGTTALVACADELAVRRAAFREAVSRGLELIEVAKVEESLEAAFLRLTGSPL